MQATCRAAPLRLDLLADPLAVRAALATLLADPLLAQLDTDLRDRTELLLAEVLNNIVEHAYGGQPGPIRLRLHQSALGLHVMAEDEGQPMPAHCLPPGALPPLQGDLPEGGFGWYLIRSLATALSYDRSRHGNRLSLLVPVNDPADQG